MDEPCPLPPPPRVRRLSRFYIDIRFLLRLSNNNRRIIIHSSVSSISVPFLERMRKKFLGPIMTGGGGGLVEGSLFRINHRGEGVNAQRKAFNNPAGRKISWKNEQVSSWILLPVGPHCAGLTHAIYAYRNSRLFSTFSLRFSLSLFLSGQIFEKGNSNERFERGLEERERDASISQERWITGRFELSK